MPKVILNTKEEKAKFYKGMNLTADAVTNTLGYAGKPTFISRGWGADPVITKDGYYTSKNIQLQDWIEDAGSMLIKTLAKKNSDFVGDNTTTVTLLAQYLLNEGNTLIENGSNPILLKLGIDKAVKKVVEFLDKISIKITDQNDIKIKQVATISANNDEVIGGMIADAYKKIGLKGRIELREGTNAETTLDIKSGAQIQRGYFDNRFINDTDKNVATLNNPHIVVFDYDINKMIELDPILRSICGALMRPNLSYIPIIIYANDFGAEVYDSIAASNANINTTIILMKPTNTYKKECMQDICALTGARMISIDTNTTPAQATFDFVGTCEKFTATKDYTLIDGGAGDVKSFDDYKRKIQVEIDDKETPEEVKEVLEKRLALISGSIGVIVAGGVTQVDMKERKDRIEDAVRATKCAIEEGVLAGGGKSMILASKSIDKETAGEFLVYRALFQPILKMLTNAGMDEENIENNVEIVRTTADTFGYNFKTEKHEDLIEAGVLDATKVVKHAIINASSVAGQMLTSGSFIIEVPERQM